MHEVDRHAALRTRHSALPASGPHPVITPCWPASGDTMLVWAVLMTAVSAIFTAMT